MPSPAPVASVRGVHVAFSGREALCDVDLDIAPGSLTVITGPNGAGKSTLLEVLAGTRAPTAGQARVSASRAFVPQRADVVERLPVTVRDVVTIGTWGRLGAWRRRDAAARRAVDTALDRLALTPLQKTPFAVLSGGQRQRALLAQGLARSAELLLLDEPTTGLDDDSAARILDAIRAEATGGVSVVCVSHDRTLIDTADRVVRLECGRIVSDAALAPR